MKFLHTEIGSAKDNAGSPVHDWYKFTAGFSHRFVDEVIALEGLIENKKAKIFDPFAGCGTTLVSAQKLGVPAVGNEAQSFMFDVIKGKLCWELKKTTIDKLLNELKVFLVENRQGYPINQIAHPLLKTLYKPYTLKTLYLIKDFIAIVRNPKYKMFLKLALSQTLHKISIHPIAIPYIVRTKTLSAKQPALKVFSAIVEKMILDTQSLSIPTDTSKIYLHDSRYPNKKIKANSCAVCITSPPYLNNLDYGEVSKVHTHFFGLTESWNDITEMVRKKLVTGSTTHYKDADFDLTKFRRSSFYRNNSLIGDSLIYRYQRLKKISSTRSGKKSFHILMMLYFQDMYKVLLEIRRVLEPNGKAYLILGDSAPYGFFVPTTKILARIAIQNGFSNYKIIKIRTRGSKWKDLTYRHNVELTENVLVLW